MNDSPPGERQTMPSQSLYRNTISQRVPQETNDGNEKHMTGHPSWNVNTCHLDDNGGDAAALSSDQSVRHRSPSSRGGFVRSASDILFLLEGCGDGEIDGDNKQKEDGLPNAAAEIQGNGVEGRTEGSDSVTTAAVLPLKTHKEGRSKGERDSFHNKTEDEVLTITTTSVTSDKGSSPYDHSRQVIVHFIL